MYRFLASRRWLVRIVAGLILVMACVRLGLWQLDRNESRVERNELIESHIDAAPAPLDALLTPADAPDHGLEWRTVKVSGRYDAEHQMQLRLRPLDGQRGVHVITPLVTSGGSALLVDRGFFRSNDQIPDVPAPPAGEVEVVARLRSTEDGRGDGHDPAEGLIRSVDVAEIEEVLPYALYPAWAEATTPDNDDLLALPPPQVEAGPHLSYAIQWFIFAAIGVGGFVFLVRAEAKGREQTAEAAPSSMRQARSADAPRPAPYGGHPTRPTGRQVP